MENLIAAGALDGWGVPRRRAALGAGAAATTDETSLPLTFIPEAADLPALSEVGAALMEQEILGLSTGEHVMIRSAPP